MSVLDHTADLKLVIFLSGYLHLSPEDYRQIETVNSGHRFPTEEKRAHLSK
jgi:hypothetical protein